MHVDRLQLYWGAPYVINANIIITPPKIKQIVDYGEQGYFSMIHTLTAIPSDMKSQLDDIGIDYEEISDFQLFQILCRTMPADKTGIILGDLDLSKLRSYRKDDKVTLADPDSGVRIDELLYERLVNYLRKLHGLKKKVEHAMNKYTKKILIEEDRQRIKMNKEKEFESFLLPLISSVKVRQGYSLDFVGNMGLFEFMDEISRLQIIHNADALLQGCYAGNIDMKKINKNDLNWMREA